MPSARDLERTIEVNQHTPCVVIAEVDFRKILHALDFLKGWSMHTENGEYAENARKLVRGEIALGTALAYGEEVPE